MSAAQQRWRAITLLSVFHTLSAIGRAHCLFLAAIVDDIKGHEDSRGLILTGARVLSAKAPGSKSCQVPLQSILGRFVNATDDECGVISCWTLWAGK